MKLINLFLALIFTTMFLTACQTIPYEGKARDIKRKPQEEGVVAIPLNFRDEDRTRATEKMQSNCNPSSVKVIEEGEVAVGQETKSSGRETDRASSETKVGTLFGMPIVSGEAGGKNTESSHVTTSIKEWQISYKCVAGATNVKSKKAAVQ